MLHWSMVRPEHHRTPQGVDRTHTQPCTTHLTEQSAPSQSIGFSSAESHTLSVLVTDKCHKQMLTRILMLEGDSSTAITIHCVVHCILLSSICVWQFYSVFDHLYHLYPPLTLYCTWPAYHVPTMCPTSVDYPWLLPWLPSLVTCLLPRPQSPPSVIG